MIDPSSIQHTWALAVPGRPVSHNDNERRHWSTRRRRAKRLRQLAWALAKKHQIPDLTGRCAVGIQVHFSDKRRRDASNYVSSMHKHLLDGLVDAGVLTDDTPGEVVELMPTIHSGAEEAHTLLLVHQLKEGENDG
ncbi:MAG: hypothetical protein WAS05_09235 [Candidatus Nanopelagicales bacterium]